MSKLKWLFFLRLPYFFYPPSKKSFIYNFLATVMCVRCGQIRSFRGCWVPHPIINYFFNLVVLYTFYSYIERLIPMPTTVPPENMGQNNKWDFLKSLWNSIWALNELSRSNKFYTWKLENLIENLKTWKLKFFWIFM